MEPFDEGLRATVKWHCLNEWWWRPTKEQDPDFRTYYDAQYEQRK
jgi:dTDP-D-glucose 4,6-dehydratase